MASAGSNQSTDPAQPANPGTPASNVLPPSNILAFLHLLQHLKTTKRAGWVQHGVPHAESISDHMYRMALLTFALPHANRDKLLKLCLAHDLAESIVGDLTPRDAVPKREKFRREEAAMRRIRDDVLLAAPGGRELYDLWKEYEDGVSEEARLVKQIDKLEMVVQAAEYERDFALPLHPFFDGTRRVFVDDTLARVDQLARAERPTDSAPSV